MPAEVSGYPHDFFDASTIQELLEKIEISPKFACANNVPHVSEYAHRITLRDRKIATPNKDGNLSDEEFCNRYVADFHREWSIHTAPMAGVFFRWTNLKTERNLSRARTVRPSVNHRTGKVEAGLSVAGGPWHYFLMHDYCYLVSGVDVGPGCDGEPVLDIATLEVRSPLLTRRGVLRKFYERTRVQITDLHARTGVSEKDVFAILIGACA